MTGFLSWIDAKTLRLLSSAVSAPPSEVEQQAHRVLIDRLLLEGSPLLRIAHSQGNLFVNAAYAHAMKTSTPDAVKVVHIAPASPTVSGPHTLADLDMVISGLRFVGSVPAVTSVIPPYASRPPGENGKKDLLGHGLIEIYLHPALSTAPRIDHHVRGALQALRPGRGVTQPGLFTATLTWDGPGDVDLHVYEPGGKKVYFEAPQGDSGQLDVDHTQEHGPEHYVANCDERRLKLGRYLVAASNYRQAQGRTATVQIATAREGVLGTRSLVLGPPTGRYPSETLFTVDVSKDAATGQVVARLLD